MELFLCFHLSHFFCFFLPSCLILCWWEKTGSFICFLYPTVHLIALLKVTASRCFSPPPSLPFRDMQCGLPLKQITSRCQATLNSCVFFPSVFLLLQDHELSFVIFTVPNPKVVSRNRKKKTKYIKLWLN